MNKLIIFLFLIPLVAQAQNTKTETIFSAGNCRVSCTETFTNDSLVSAYVSCEAKDDRLSTLKNYFTIVYDSPQNLYSFLTDLEKFCSDNSSTSSELNKHKVEIDKSTGSRMVKVYDERGMIFHRFPPSLIPKLKASLSEWASKYGMKLE